MEFIKSPQRAHPGGILGPQRGGAYRNWKPRSRSVSLQQGLVGLSEPSKPLESRKLGAFCPGGTQVREAPESRALSSCISLLARISRAGYSGLRGWNSRCEDILLLAHPASQSGTGLVPEPPWVPGLHEVWYSLYPPGPSGPPVPSLPNPSL